MRRAPWPGAGSAPLAERAILCGISTSQVDPIVASFTGGAVGVISTLLVVEINNVKVRASVAPRSSPASRARASPQTLTWPRRLPPSSLSGSKTRASAASTARAKGTSAARSAPRRGASFLRKGRRGCAQPAAAVQRRAAACSGAGGGPPASLPALHFSHLGAAAQGAGDVTLVSRCAGDVHVVPVHRAGDGNRARPAHRPVRLKRSRTGRAVC